MRSYQKINYSLRPAKHAERKMLCEAFRCLAPFGVVDSYRYIGFGSPHFADFRLFHQQLGISEMISIEGSEDDEARFLFNVPYCCVKLEMGMSWEVLPSVTWDGIRTILWLDYDDPLDTMALDDIGTFCTKAAQGSVLLVTVDAHQLKRCDGDLGRVLAELRNTIGEERLPGGLRHRDVAGDGLLAVLKSVIDSKIRETLQRRSGPLPDAAKFVYKPLFYLAYQDGAQMLTVGGLLHDVGQKFLAESCGFDRLHFLSAGERENELFRIRMPLLTFREIDKIESILPRGDIESLCESGFPQEEVEKYREVYRYFPKFAEASL